MSNPPLFSLVLLSFATSWITKYNRLFIILCDLIQVIYFEIFKITLEEGVMDSTDGSLQHQRMRGARGR